MSELKDLFGLIAYFGGMFLIAFAIAALILTPLLHFGYHWTGKVEKTVIVDVVKVKHEYVPYFDMHTTTIYSADDLTQTFVGNHSFVLGEYKVTYNDYYPVSIEYWWGKQLLSLEYTEKR